jgi:hypothetical protein
VSAVAAVLAIAVTVQAQTPPPNTCPHAVAWDANSEPDVTGYEVSWGPLPGAYRRSALVVAPETAATVYVPHGTSYVAVRAFNADRWASEYSEAVQVTCDAGDERPPRRVATVTGQVLRNVPVS